MAAALIRRTPERQQADAWTLALASQGISSWLHQSGAEWDVLVAEASAARAAATLDAYDRENSPQGDGTGRVHGTGSTVRAAPSPRRAAAAALAVSGTLLAFHAATVAAGRALAYAVGTARAEMMTAMTLHADAGHVVANAFFGALFLAALFQRAGIGIGLGLTVFAGALATYANAALRGPPYDGLGASTGVFAALGALGGLAAVDRAAARRTWIPMLAAAAMAAMFGTSETTDVTAHALGFVAGGGCALLASRWIRAWSRNRLAQWTGGLAAVSVVIAAWAAAVGAAP
jgi:membrane associated rhomboid family serine protease